MSLPSCVPTGQSSARAVMCNLMQMPPIKKPTRWPLCLNLPVCAKGKQHACWCQITTFTVATETILLFDCYLFDNTLLWQALCLTAPTYVTS